MIRDLDQLSRQDHINDMTYHASINMALSAMATRLNLSLSDMIKLARKNGNNGIIER